MNIFIRLPENYSPKYVEGGFCELRIDGILEISQEFIVDSSPLASLALVGQHGGAD
jgi:hypothetical protein